MPGATAPAPASRGCRCTQSPRRRCRPERVTSPRAGEERARRGRGVASPCRTSRTSCHERRPSSRRRLTLRLILTGRMFFQRQRFSWGGAAVGNGIFEAERRCIHNCCVRIWAHQRLLIGNLCKFDHCAVGLVVEGGGVPDLRRRFAMGRSERGRARLYRGPRPGFSTVRPLSSLPQNDSDASSLPQSLAQSLEPSERGSDDCPILSEDSRSPASPVLRLR